MFKSCASCHRTSGPAPFSLTTYDEVRRRATQVAAVTRSRFMPPWKVEPGVESFVGQRPLTEAQIDLIETLGQERSPVDGDAAAMPPRPDWSDGWLLGKPDLIVKPRGPSRFRRSRRDAFRIFAMRLPVSKRTYVRGIEFHPGNARVVHHANIRIDRTAASRQLDEADPLPGYDGLMPRSAEYPDGHFLGWTPGQVAPLVAAGPGVGARARQRPRRAAAHAAERRSGAGAARDRFLFQRPPTNADADDPAAWLAGHRHPGRRVALRDSRFLHAAGGRRPAGGAAARPLPRARDSRHGRRCPTAALASVMHIKDWDFRWQHVYR